jgi:hypothetical protein
MMSLDRLRQVWWREYLRNLSGTIARVVLSREVPTGLS